ncbi:MAG: hypothetical protein U1E16_01535 [Hyphomicrobiales bacterium]
MAWIVTGIVATLLQWSLFAAVTGVSATYALKPGVLFDSARPVAAGALVAWASRRRARRSRACRRATAGAAGIALVERASNRAAPLVTALNVAPAAGRSRRRFRSPPPWCCSRWHWALPAPRRRQMQGGGRPVPQPPTARLET